MWHQGFEPVIDDKSRVLILGSFPSIKSREQGFYYGNPQNRFWNMLSTVLGENVPKDISGRKEFLLRHGVALWDVIKSSTITSSKDSDITEDNSIPVDFNEVLCKYPNLKLILCNGNLSYQTFIKFNPNCKIPCIKMQSTSSANGRYKVDGWVTAIKSAL